MENIKEIFHWILSSRQDGPCKKKEEIYKKP